MRHFPHGHGPGGPGGPGGFFGRGPGKPMRSSGVEIVKLDKTNAFFYKKDGFISMDLQNKDGEKQNFSRVFLHRAFPFDLLWQYISVLDEDGVEIGIVYDIKDFEEETVILLKTEIERKYYQPVIVNIVSLKERYGFSYWTVKTSDKREVSFTMQDTFRNIIRVGEDKAVLMDVDGNRFVIESISLLDRKSYRKIELYL